jgi:clan AA aspartic protease
MINGTVNSRFEAILVLDVHDSSGAAHKIQAVIDTGFGGYLTLPSSAIRSFELASVGRQSGILADGSKVFFDVYAGEVLWEGTKRRIELHAADADPLVGMAMFAEHEIKIHVKNGGAVEVVHKA